MGPYPVEGNISLCGSFPSVFRFPVSGQKFPCAREEKSQIFPFTYREIFPYIWGNISLCMGNIFPYMLKEIFIKYFPVSFTIEGNI